MENERKLPYYAGEEFADLSKHDGGLLHAVGASNYQVMRANRTKTDTSDGFGYTYNHAPMMTFYRGKFYLQYLSNPIHEHTGGGHSLLVTSKNGIDWSFPEVSFPVIRIPAGKYTCSNGTVVEVPDEKEGFMHQRMGFFQSKSDRLFVLGFYGHAPHHDVCPWNTYGMGRVIREVFEDGKMGDIYFIRYLDYSGWTEEKLPFPYYKSCPDSGFVECCEELLGDRLVTQQWREEHGYRDETIGFKLFAKDPNGDAPSNTPYEASSSFCWYNIDEKQVIGYWKQGKVGRSDDGGKTWVIEYEPSFVTSGAKTWAQKHKEDLYTVSYDNSLSSEHRYPLVTLSSFDGIKFDSMSCVYGELPPRRYEGTYKDFGPQYIRGIEGNCREYPFDALWLCHSINKEDIGVTRVPLPIRREVTEHVNDTFENDTDFVRDWNIYSTVWSTVRPVILYGSEPVLRISDKDPCDYARAMRIFPRSKKINVSLDFMCAGQYDENLEIELQDLHGTPACRVIIGGGKVKVLYGSNIEEAFWLPSAVMWHTLQFNVSCPDNTYRIELNGNEFDDGAPYRFFSKVNSVERLIIRTKPRRYLPNNEIYPETPDLPGVDEPLSERIYYIRNVKTEAGE